MRKTQRRLVCHGATAKELSPRGDEFSGTYSMQSLRAFTMGLREKITNLRDVPAAYYARGETAEMRAEGEAWQKSYVQMRRICVHCNMTQKQHARDNKCLFVSTCYAPLNHAAEAQYVEDQLRKTHAIAD